MKTLWIERRFHGPPDSGNGGYVSGRLAAFVDGPVVVRLRTPPPLDILMEVRAADGGVDLLHGDAIIATARPAEVSIDPPSPPTYASAEAASRSYRGFHWHPFPGCFVCGPTRKASDGLRLFAGPVSGTNIVAEYPGAVRLPPLHFQSPAAGTAAGDGRIVPAVRGGGGFEAQRDIRPLACLYQILARQFQWPSGFFFVTGIKHDDRQ